MRYRLTLDEWKDVRATMLLLEWKRDPFVLNHGSGRVQHWFMPGRDVLRATPPDLSATRDDGFMMLGCAEHVADTLGFNQEFRSG